jgi:protein phosphatase
MIASGATDLGRRRSSNEDAFCVEPDLGLLAVADGVAGRAAGEVASRLALSIFAAYVRDRLPATAEDSLLDLIAEAVQASNAAILRRVAEEPQNSGLATTLTVCLVQASTAYFAHVGDSRAYLLRQAQIRRLTEDHAVVSRCRHESSSEADARARPVRRRLLAALGLPWSGVDIFTEALEAGDGLLLCTDGLTAEIADDELRHLATSNGSLADRCRTMVETANERGGSDNVTVVLAGFHGF